MQRTGNGYCGEFWKYTDTPMSDCNNNSIQYSIYKAHNKRLN